MLGTSRVLCVFLKGFPRTKRTESFIVPTFSLLIRLIQLFLEVCKPALKVKEIPCAEPVEFTEDEGLIAWVDSYHVSQSWETSLPWRIFYIHC